MILKQIQKSRNPEKIYLIFDSRSPLPFFLDDYVREKLRLHQEVDPTLLTHLSTLSLHFLLRSYGLGRLAASPHIRATLSPRLLRQSLLYQRKWQIELDPKPIIEEILSSFDSQGLLDSVSFASSLVRRHPKKSHRYLQQLFSHYHLDTSLLPPSTDQDIIRLHLLKKSTLFSKPMDFKTKTRLISSLAQKGFAYDDIKTVIDEMTKTR